MKIVEDEARKAKNVSKMRTFGESDKSQKTISSMVSKKGDPPAAANSDGLDSPGVILFSAFSAFMLLFAVCF